MGVRVGVEKVREGKGQGGGACGRKRAGAKTPLLLDAPPMAPAVQSASACVWAWKKCVRAKVKARACAGAIGRAQKTPLLLTHRWKS